MTVADFLRRHVGHAPGDLVDILPVVELAQESDDVDAALEDALVRKLQPSSAPPSRE